MKTLWDATTRRDLQSRLATIAPHTKPGWGKMSAPAMMTHLADSLRMAMGDLACTPKPSPLRAFPLKQLVVYWAPWPKGVPTAPELLARAPAPWTTEVTDVTALMDRLAARADGPFGDHPAFGRLTSRAWGRLMFRHVDHHLRQFGV